MAKFTALKPEEVKLGRGREAAERRRPFVEAVQSMAAGAIEVERGEKPATVKRLLTEAAHESGIRIRSSWEDKSQKTLLWKRFAGKAAAKPGK